MPSIHHKIRTLLCNLTILINQLLLSILYILSDDMSIIPGEYAGKDKINVKLLLLGQANVGKSSLMLRYADKKFYDNKITTIGIQNKNMMIDVNNKKVNLQIWDTAGQEKWKHVPTSYYRGVKGIILVYDISYHQSFAKVNDWIQKINENTEIQKISLILVGNKSDLEREVNQTQGQKFAQQNKMLFLETSAKYNTNVQNLFLKITECILQKFCPVNIPKQISIIENPAEQPKPSVEKCC